MNNDYSQQAGQDVFRPPDILAGWFTPWLRRTRRALRLGRGTNVPCEECNACCRAGYFITIRPGETALDRINPKLLFPAPGIPGGKVIGRDAQGQCPLLQDGRCTIYADRPLTCRMYDCRVFAAAGIAAGDSGQDEVSRQARRWRFAYRSARDRERHAAVRDAAAFLRDRADCFPGGRAPRLPAQIAVLAIVVYPVFLQLRDEAKRTGQPAADSEVARAIMEASARFGDGG